jgi:hypothetical protein
MKISESAVYWNTDHSWAQKAETKESIRIWIGDPPGSERTPPERKDRVELSPRALAVKPLESEMEPVPSDGGDTLEILIVEKLIQMVTGRTVKITVPRQPESSRESDADTPLPTGGEAPAAGTEREGWGLEYSRVETFSEEEHLGVRAEGLIKTQDGREFRFQAHLQMDRTYFVQESINLRAGDAAKMDPLVINWDGQGVRLTENKFGFDLNADGSPESVSWLQTGSGFLALDRDQDGLINNGRELFGPQSGNGFQDLAEYDQDRSGWIDEEDPVFGRLQVWSREADGTETLRTLVDAGVGAIATGYASSPFQIKNSSNESLGEVVRSGIYFQEDGGSGFVQQINLTV